MKLKLRLLVERHQDDAYTASVLGLPTRGPSRPSPQPFAPVSLISGYGEDLDAIVARLSKEVSKRLGQLAPEVVARFRLDPEPEVATVEVQLTPDSPLGGRPMEPITVPVTVLVTRFPEPPHAVLVPRLGIRLAVKDAEKALSTTAAEIAAYLRRRPELRSLRGLFHLHATVATELRLLDVEAVLRGPLDSLENERRTKEKNEESQRKRDDEVLESVATNLAAEDPRPAYECEEVVGQILEFVRSDSEKGLVLVGPAGAGKTAALHEAVRRLASSPAPRRIHETSGSRLIAGMTMFGEWQERCRSLVEALSRRRDILYVGDPHELLENGQAVCCDVSIAQYLKRPIEEGRLRLIAECTEEAHAALERIDQGFASLFRLVKVPEAEKPRALAVLTQVAGELERDGRARATRDGLERCHELLARYLPYAAFPGKGVRFLERLASPRRRDDPPSLGRLEVTRAFARMSGLPVSILDDAVELDPDTVRGFFKERVVGQERATSLVADSVLRIKAGLADPRRPLGSFLFLGPTGVGKTETAKVLAEFLFGSRERLVRIDMTEYQDPFAAVRLTGGPTGDGEGDLTRPVRAEPFSVLLLDEIEKAHPSVFDLLLQVLGDARLTDARGRVTDYRSAFVLLTSNLGSELPESPPGFGRREAEDRFTEAALGFFRPELVNRLDAVVPFAALGRETIEAIATREIDRALARDGLKRRGTMVEIAPELRSKVVASGHHPRYGARPLKRAVEDLLMRPLALDLAGRTAPPRRVRLVLDGDLPSVVVLEGPAPARGLLAVAPLKDAPPRDRAKDGTELPERFRINELLDRLAGLRRESTAEVQSDVATDVRDEITTLRARIARDDERRRRRKSTSADAGDQRARLGHLGEALERVERANREIEDLEELCLGAFLEGDEEAVAATASALVKLKREASLASVFLRAERLNSARAVLVLIAPPVNATSFAAPLACAYVRFAEAHEWEIRRYVEGRKPEGRAKKPAPAWFSTPAFPGERDEPPSPPEGSTGALALLVLGRHSPVFFSTEPGLHKQVLVDAGKPEGRGGRKGKEKPRDVERLALVTTTPLGTPNRAPTVSEIGDALMRIFTVPVPGETEPRGLRPGLPAVARTYYDASSSVFGPWGEMLEGTIESLELLIDDFVHARLKGPDHA